MTNEQLDEFIKKNEAQVVSVLRAQGYYAEKKQTLPILSETNLVVGSLRFVDIFGIPQAGIKVVFHALPQNNKIQDNGITYNIGSSSDVRIITSNVEGLVSVKFVKGSRVFFTVERSDIKRQITIPNSSFNLLDIEADVSDTYTSPLPPYEALIKSTMP